MPRSPKCVLNPSGVKRFGNALKAYLDSRAGQRLLEETVDGARAWDRGGCGYLADSIKAWAPGFVKREMLTRWRYAYSPVRARMERNGRAVSHVLAKVDGYYLDAQGARSRVEVLRDWNAGDRAHSFYPYDGRQVRLDVAQCISRGKHDLLEALQERFGDPKIWFCKRPRAKL